MRPTKLTISAFGPYAGKVEIPLDKLGTKGLYLICGDTGAGKTTVFDAISYALFGEPSGEGKGGRTTKTLRSDFADPDTETYVELDFEYRGQTHHIRRNPEYLRPKKRGSGMTKQTSNAEYLRPDGSVLTRDTDVNAAIEELLGIDGKQFSQIAMIAQGEFRKLLTADTKTRASILRKLFDTSINERFATSLDRKRSELEEESRREKDSVKNAAERACFPEDSALDLERLRLLHEELPLGSWLQGALKEQAENDLAMEAELSRQKDAATNKINEANRLVTQMEALKSAHEELPLATARLDELEKSLPGLKSALDMAKSRDGEGKELEASVHALRASLPQYDEHDRLLKEILQMQDSLEQTKLDGDAQAKLVEQTKAQLDEIEASMTALADSPAQLAKAKAANQEAARVLALATEELERHERLDSLKAEASELQGVLNKARKANELAQADLEAAKAQVTDARGLTESLKGAEQLASERTIALSEIQNELNGLTQTLRQLELLQDNFRNASSAHKNAGVDLLRQHKLLDAANKELSDIERLRSLEQAGILAENLIEGEPCPVCGSCEHPAPRPLPDHAPSAEEAESAHTKLDVAQGNYDKAHEVTVAKLALKNEAKDRLEKFESENGSVEVLQNRITSCKQIKETAKAELDLAYKRKLDLDKAKQVLADAESAKESCDQKAFASKEELNKAGLALANSSTRIEELTTSLKHPSRVEAQRAHDGAAQAQEQANSFLRQAEQNEHKHAELAKQQAKADKRLKDAASKLDELRQIWSDTNNKLASLEGRKLAIAASLPYPAEAEARKKLQEAENTIATINKNRKEAEAAFNKASNEIRSTKAQITALEEALKDAPTVDVEAQKEIANTERQKLDEIHRRESDLSYRMRTNADIASKLERALRTSADLEECYGQIRELSQVATGKLTGQARVSFETYVQGIYFDRIIEAANRRLVDLTSGRYELQRHLEGDNRRGQTGLDLDVMDHFTGHARNASSLSGGESFQASLCLALGLSDVVQAFAGGIQLDTMFIDEGFGSLDQEALNAAMRMLSSLSSENKLIGIISHVEDLKGSIDRKIVVKRTPHGSQLSLEA